MDQLTLREKVGVNYMLLELTGAVNSYTSSDLQEKVYSYIVDTNVVLDMEQVTQLDSSGVGIVIAGHNSGEENKTKLFVMNPSEAARRSLERTGFFDMFNVIHSVTEVSDD
ncbi:MAG: STAS domain-containing protein [Treponema sp.]|nr:STAS domain-containing protein [Treponema sp.]